MPNATGIMPRNWTMPHESPLMARFLGKIVLDILPAALASVIGGFLFTQYQFGHAAASRPLEQVAPASAEMVQMVHDEHAMIIDYLKSQSAAERSRAAAEDEASARAAAEAKAAADTKAVADAKALAEKASSEKALAEAATRRLAAPAAAKPVIARVKPPTAIAATSAQAPLVIAQAEQTNGMAPQDRLARDPDSLLAKTLDLKDHVVAATRHVVSAISDIFASLGERIGGLNPNAGGRQFSSAL